MSESTKRVLRTGYQIVAALVVAVPLILLGLPEDVAAAPVAVAVGVWIAAVAKIINSLEDAGVIPAWLKDE